MRLPPEEIFRYALEAGFSPDQAVTMTAVALAESGGNPGAHNPVGEDSIGLWQVNRQAHPQFLGLDAADPLTNARMAFEVSGGGADIGRWTVTHADRGAPYLRYRAQAEAAAVANGYPEAVGQWEPPENYSPIVNAGPRATDPPPPTAPEPPVDAPPDGAPEGGVDRLDHDSDGLVERYEQAIGTDTEAVDTDRDGFADSVEVVGGTDPLDFASNPLVTPTGGEVAFRPDLTTVTPNARAAPPISEPPTPGVTPVTTPETTAPAPAPAPEGGPLDTFLDAALSQDGAPYIFGAEVDPTDVDPKAGGEAFDCSELVEWAAARAGVHVPDGSYHQYLQLRDLGSELTVEEALETPGALVFNFSSEPVPGGGRPAGAHVAISLGNGRLIEARGRSYGVGQFDAADRELSHAAFIPELGTELDAGLVGVDGEVVDDPLPPMADTDVDGLLDAYERLIAIDPFGADTDRDGFLDSVELAYDTDPLDFSDNPLVGEGSGTGYHPPLTTEVAPVGSPAAPDPGWASPTASEDRAWGSEQLTLVDTHDDPTDVGEVDWAADGALVEHWPDDDRADRGDDELPDDAPDDNFGDDAFDDDRFDHGGDDAP